MRPHPLGLDLCMAGRYAFFSGRWDNMPPCRNVGNNHIHTDGVIEIDGVMLTQIDLCDGHFDQVNSAGLITMPFMAHLPPGAEGWILGPPEDSQ